MRICILSQGRLEFAGGVESYIKSLSSYLSSYQHDVVLISRGLIRAKSTSADINHANAARILRVPQPIYMIGLLMSSFLAVFKVLHENRHKRIDVIHAAVDCGYSGLAGLVSSKITGVPLCCSIHSQRRPLLSHYFFKGLVGWLILNFDSAIERLVYFKAHEIIALSASLRNYVLSFGVDSKKITVIPVAIQTECFGAVNEKRHESKTFPSESRFKIGYVGRLEREKNILTLLQAFEGIVRTRPDMHLLLIGDGNLKNVLIEYAKTKNISKNVHFLGARQDIADWLQIFDIFVLPSYTEGMPIALLESMAAGKAIIASNIQGIREMVRHNEEAILVNPYDVEELRQAILLLYNNPNLRAKLGRNAKEKAKLYDVAVVYKRIVKVYQELIRCRAKNVMQYRT